MLKAKRIAGGLSQKQVAEGASVSLDFVARVECGEGRLTLDSLVRFAKVLKYKKLANLFEEAGL